MVISKSEFMLYLRHPAWLWLKKFDKNKIPIPDEELQARFDEGTLFEVYAEKLFLHPQAGGAAKLGYKNGNDFSGTKYYALPELTRKELEKGTGVIFQGRVEADNITAIFDVLEKANDDSYNLYEIKSSTTVKPEHVYDLAFQTIVLEKSGLKLKNISVIHVNNEYVKNGEIEPDKISKVENITEDVRAVLGETEENIRKAFKVLESKTMPDVSPRYLKNSTLDEWMPIYEAVKGSVDDYSIYNLCTLKPEMIGLLEDQGIKRIEDIPLDMGLSDKQLKQVIATKTGERSIEKGEIKEFLESLKFPLHFFDYETLSGVIPYFDGTRPYQQIPFQYSLHIWPTSESELIHREYLHKTATNPVLPLLESMKKDFEGSGSIVSWSKKFEAARNNEMAKAYPEYKKFLMDINERMVDLMNPFSKCWFVDKDFFGSASIKNVLPVLVPELSYKDLEVSHGGQAQRIWMNTVLQNKNPKEKEKIFENLSKYCTLDTYSMIAIYKYLVEVLKN